MREPRNILPPKGTLPYNSVFWGQRIIWWQSALFINFRSLEIVNIIEVPFIPEFWRMRKKKISLRM